MTRQIGNASSKKRLSTKEKNANLHKRSTTQKRQKGSKQKIAPKSNSQTRSKKKEMTQKWKGTNDLFQNGIIVFGIHLNEVISFAFIGSLFLL
jgi:hypothetical protein